MNISKAQIKQLIEAVIREAEDMTKQPDNTEPEEGPLSADPNPELAQAKHTQELEQKLKSMKGTKIELYVKFGVKKGKQEFRSLLQKMAQEARAKDFEVIMGVVKKGDKIVDAAAKTGLLPTTPGEIDPEDAKAANLAGYQQSGVNVKDPSVSSKPEGKPEITGRTTVSKMVDIINRLPTEEEKLEFFDKLLKSEKKGVMNKLAGMGKEGEKIRMALTRQLPLDKLTPDEEEWNRMNPNEPQKKPVAIDWNRMNRDEAGEKSRLAKERKKIEAEKQAEWGLPDEKFELIDPIKYLDSKYWTDKEWDRHDLGGETQASTAGVDTKHAGKQVYRPNYSAKKVDPALLKKMAIGTLREIKNRRNK